MDNNIATLLSNLIAVDQGLRKNKIFSETLMQKFDHISTDVIKALVDKFGLPTPENVGVEAARYFIVLLIHTSDMSYVSTLSNTPEFRRVDYNKTQCFGTVVTTKKDKKGKFVTKPLPIEDDKNVDKRRQKYGLPPLADYIKVSEETFNNFIKGKPK